MALPDETVWHGREAIIDGWERWMGQWDDYRLTMTELEAYGNDSVVMEVHLDARGRESGAPISVHHSQAWTFRDGLVRAVGVYVTRADAVASLSRWAPDAAGDPRTPPAP